MNALSSVEVSVTDGVARLTLNRPDSLNAWTRELAVELREALERLGDDDHVRAVVLTGAGRAFSAGADLRAEHELTPTGAPNVAGRLQTDYNPLILAVRR